jgi:hypothetical protein
MVLPRGRKMSVRSPPPPEMGGNQSKCSESDLQTLVNEGLLQSKEVIRWRPATGVKRPLEGVDEIVLFQYFVERGLALPTSDSFCGLLFYYGIQLHYLNSNSILHISIFVQFCKVFLEICMMHAKKR